MVTPGSTAPVVSVTVPLSVASCANTAAGNIKMAMTTTTHGDRLPKLSIEPPGRIVDNRCGERRRYTDADVRAPMYTRGVWKSTTGTIGAMTAIHVNRRLLVGLVTFVVPLLTMLAADGIAQMRLAGTMTERANAFLAALSPEQRDRVQFNFATLERFNWHYIPRMRKGLALRELSPSQKTAALDLMKSGLSAS